MKICNACHAEFEDNFGFCPIDAMPLQSLVEQHLAAQFHLTVIYSPGLLARLLTEIYFLLLRLKSEWPLIRRHPLRFAKETLVDTVRSVGRAFETHNAIAGVGTALGVLIVVVTAVVLLDRVAPRARGESQQAEQELTLLSLNTPPEKPTGSGVGVGAKGRVGINNGSGEGSKPQRKSSRGGGGGGDHHQSPAQGGALPPPSEIPAPILQLPAPRNSALAVAGIDIDPLLGKALPAQNFGDPRSTAMASTGPGSDGGVGTGKGTGVGEGKDSGFGPGAKGNTGGNEKDPGGAGSSGSSGNNPDDPSRVFPVSQVHQRVRLLVKPEPQYSEEARMNQIVGTVVLRVVFSRSGEVTNIRAVQALPFGLTERAIAAARQIRFMPALRDGKAVSVHMQLEYNFNLY